MVQELFFWLWVLFCCGCSRVAGSSLWNRRAHAANKNSCHSLYLRLLLVWVLFAATHPQQKKHVAHLQQESTGNRETNTLTPMVPAHFLCPNKPCSNYYVRSSGFQYDSKQSPWRYAPQSRGIGFFVSWVEASIPKLPAPKPIALSPKPYLLTNLSI